MSCVNQFKNIIFSLPYITNKCAGKPRCCFTYEELHNLPPSEVPDNKCGDRMSFMGIQFRYVQVSHKNFSFVDSPLMMVFRCDGTKHGDGNHNTTGFSTIGEDKKSCDNEVSTPTPNTPNTTTAASPTNKGRYVKRSPLP